MLDDLTSDTLSDTSSDSEDPDDVLKKNAKGELVVKELDFEQNEKLTFTKDVYNYTICAYMTKCCSPIQRGFALK